MAAMGVVPALDEFEAGHARFYLGLKRRRSRSSHSSVAKKLSHIALSNQSPTEPIEGRTPASRQRRPKASEVYWLPWVGMMNHGGRPPLPQRHIERLQHQFGAQRGFHRPADASAAESVEHHRQVKKPGPGREVSFESIPRSSRSTRCSRRSRLSSSRSAVVSPSRRRSSSPAG